MVYAGVVRAVVWSDVSIVFYEVCAHDKFLGPVKLSLSGYVTLTIRSLLYTRTKLMNSKYT